jgi:L-alanine-DL-glutamate epimerase-like enolase superfamily enzyme
MTTLRPHTAWRSFSFLKITTACGMIGWSGDNEDVGSRGLSPVIEAVALLLGGADPRVFEAIVARPHVAARQTRGGINRQAIGSVETALCDIRGKQVQTRVHVPFGSPIRERMRVSWSHVGTDRVAQRGQGFRSDPRRYNDLAAAAAEVKAQAFCCRKINLFRWRDGTPQDVNRGFRRPPRASADSTEDAVGARPPRTRPSFHPGDRPWPSTRS